MDALRELDGMPVAIKHVKGDMSEVEIARYMSSASLRDDEHNRSVPILDIIPIPNDTALIVMPLLALWYTVNMEDTDQAVDFMSQALEVNASFRNS
jgi:hypothetical protein